MAKITFDHAVIYNGIFYPTGSEIKTKDEIIKEVDAPEIPKKANTSKKTNK